MAACDAVFPERIQVCRLLPRKALSESSGRRDPLVYFEQNVVGVSPKEAEKAPKQIEKSWMKVKNKNKKIL